MIEIRVIGDDREQIKSDIAFLAEQFGVLTTGVSVERVSDDTLVGTATGETEAPKRRGRKSNAEKAAEALSGASAPPEEEAGAAEDPFGQDDSKEEVDLEKLKVATLERLQRLYASRGGVDSGNALLAKHGNGVKKFAKLPLEVFPKIAADLDTLEVA